MPTVAITYLRAMTPADLPEVLAVERASFPHSAWDEREFRRVLRRPECTGAVACFGLSVVGYCVDEVEPGCRRLLNLAVHPNWLRKGVGTTFMDFLKARVTRRRPVVEADVRERNVVGCFFMRANGFRCERIVPGCYEGTDEAAYCFTYHREDRPCASK